jgi:hypothetical protein
LLLLLILYGGLHSAISDSVSRAVVVTAVVTAVVVIVIIVIVIVIVIVTGVVVLSCNCGRISNDTLRARVASLSADGLNAAFAAVLQNVNNGSAFRNGVGAALKCSLLFSNLLC